MPTALDIETEVYAAIRHLLEARSAWTDLISEGNRIWYNDLVGTQTADVTNTMDGDYNTAEMYIRAGDNSLRTTDETFGTYSDSGCPNWIEKQQTVVHLELISQKQNNVDIHVLRKETVAAIRAGGAKLGLSYVTGVRTTWNITRSDVPNDETASRWKCSLDVTVASEVPTTVE